MLAMIRSLINLPIKTKIKNFLAGNSEAPANMPTTSKRGFGI